MVDARDWAAAPSRPAMTAASADGEHLTGMAALLDFGGRTLCEQADVAYDELLVAERMHYQQMAYAVFVAMWDFAVTENITADVEHVTTDGEPIEQEPRP